LIDINLVYGNLEIKMAEEKNMEEILGGQKILPVIALEDADDAMPLTEALIAGGIKVVEITLRTEEALDAIKILSSNGISVGAGTITSAKSLTRAIEAGAKFFISPGITDKIAQKALELRVPFMPGISTPSEVMKAMEYGIEYMKFFPAEISGGTKKLKYYSELFQDVFFCPTGGVNAKNYKDYLHLDNVFCVGGSWLTPQETILKKDWQAITKLALEAASHS